MPVHDTDYLVIGAGAAGMAFADTVVEETDVHVTIVDRRGRPGGHWNDAYPFVALHQPSAFYRVNSTPLGSGRKDAHGVNAGMYELASGAEVTGYHDAVMRRRLLPTGRVTWLPMSDYRGDGRVVSPLLGCETRIAIRRKTVDATHGSPTIPAHHHRGFAVVADLVSALAMRAEEEAKRARDQLTVTQTDIVTAVEAVTKVDGALANISGDVAQVHELLATMAADNQAQSAAITQISAAIGTMDQSTQQNAAMVEETSAAARNLASEVGNLADQAGRFKVAQGGSRAAAPARKPDYVTPGAYTSPIKPLPAAAIPAMVRADDDWKSF